MLASAYWRTGAVPDIGFSSESIDFVGVGAGLPDEDESSGFALGVPGVGAALPDASGLTGDAGHMAGDAGHVAGDAGGAAGESGDMAGGLGPPTG